MPESTPGLPSVAVAESLTCGRLQALIGAVSGASAYFRGGVTAYTWEQKVRLLGVEPSHAASVDCVSERVAREMAAGVRPLFGADIGLATTGYAEPREGVPEPFAWWALCFGKQSEAVFETGRIVLPGRSRVEAQCDAATQVFARWRAHLAERGIHLPTTLPQRA
ncbi:MAG: nicotinamide-nucleotide amidohydrolase family protein [Opitutaceae bacterium]|nr:nicotinamide-nucleotide amidohydrolase family protein [Opitutaceae bacterium]